MKAYQIRNIVHANFNIANSSICAVDARGKASKTFFNAEGVETILIMIERSIMEDINELEQREVDEVVKEVVG